jgi:hypothetical protein
VAGSEVLLLAWSARVACPGEAALNTLPGGQGGLMLDDRSSSSRPGIMLHRDGTIIVGHGHVGSADRVEFIDGSPEAIATFNQAGIPVAVVTNQDGVARGLLGIDDVARVHRHIVERLAEHGAHMSRAGVDEVLVNLHHLPDVARRYVADGSASPAFHPSVLGEIDSSPPPDIGYDLLPRLAGRTRAALVEGYFRDIAPLTHIDQPGRSGPHGAAQ